MKPAKPQETRSTIRFSARLFPPNSPLKKPPGGGTGPTRHGDFRGNLVGRVPSRGEQDDLKRAAKATEKIGSWTLLTLPKNASAKLPSRGITMVEGVINSLPFRAALEPDGKGSQWLRVNQAMRDAAR